MAPVQKPIRSQTRITFVGEAVPSIQPSLAQVAAVAIQHDWGPLGTDKGGNVECSTIDQFDTAFGNSNTVGRRAVLAALDGQGDAGGGAGTVIVHRQAAAAVAATCTLQNTSSTTALVLTAEYLGTRGSRLIAVAADYALDTTQTEIDLYLDVVAGDPLERWIFPDANLSQIAATLTASSKYVSNAVATGTTALKAQTVAFAGGSDGTALVAQNYVDTLRALTFARFFALAFQDLTDATILQTVKAWVQDQSTKNRPVTLVTGGASVDSLSTAVARATALADPHIITLGIGQYTHDMFAGITFSTAQLAPRVAGVLCARGQERALTFAKVSGLHVVGNTGALDSELEVAVVSGVTAFSRALSADVELKIERGVTTFTVGDTGRPVDVFGDPRLVGIMDLFVRGMKEWGDENIIGNRTVTQETRDAVQAEVRARQVALEDRGLILPGTSFVDVPVPDDPALADAIPFTFGWQFARTANYVLGQGKVR